AHLVGMTNQPTLNELWAQTRAGNDPLEELVYLSNLLGREQRLVQPVGGNTSIKFTLPSPDGGQTQALLVKGSRPALRNIKREGFIRLSLAKLGGLGQVDAMSGADMMRFMAGCMLTQGPAPSEETPLHSLLPYKVNAHTHEVATMSLTNVGDGLAQ